MAEDGGGFAKPLHRVEFAEKRRAAAEQDYTGAAEHRNVRTASFGTARLHSAYTVNIQIVASKLNKLF